MANPKNNTEEKINTDRLRKGKTATGKVEDIPGGVMEGSPKDNPEIFLAEDRKLGDHPNPHPNPHSSSHRGG